MSAGSLRPLSPPQASGAVTRRLCAYLQRSRSKIPRLCNSSDSVESVAQQVQNYFGELMAVAHAAKVREIDDRYKDVRKLIRS